MSVMYVSQEDLLGCFAFEERLWKWEKQLGMMWCGEVVVCGGVVGGMWREILWERGYMG